MFSHEFLRVAEPVLHLDLKPMDDWELAPCRLGPNPSSATQIELQDWLAASLSELKKLHPFDDCELFFELGTGLLKYILEQHRSLLLEVIKEDPELVNLCLVGHLNSPAFEHEELLLFMEQVQDWPQQVAELLRRRAHELYRLWQENPTGIALPTDVEAKFQDPVLAGLMDSSNEHFAFTIYPLAKTLEAYGLPPVLTLWAWHISEGVNSHSKLLRILEGNPHLKALKALEKAHPGSAAKLFAALNILCFDRYELDTLQGLCTALETDQPTKGIILTCSDDNNRSSYRDSFRTSMATRPQGYWIFEFHDGSLYGDKLRKLAQRYGRSRILMMNSHGNDERGFHITGNLYLQDEGVFEPFCATLSEVLTEGAQIYVLSCFSGVKGNTAEALSQRGFYCVGSPGISSDQTHWDSGNPVVTFSMVNAEGKRVPVEAVVYAAQTSTG